jgi:hypothetical protein
MRKRIIKTETLIEIESLHRFVFDNLYVQTKKKYSEEELKKKKRYEELCEQTPNWRQLLINTYKSENVAEEVKERIGKIIKVHKGVSRYGTV